MAFHDLSGTKLGQYDLIEELGRGGTGAIYRAHQAMLKRDVAVRVFTPALSSSDPQFKERFMRAMDSAARLEHAHIVPVYDYGIQEEYYYQVTRLLHGGSLHDRFRSGPLDLPLANRIAGHITSAVGYAHEQGLIHHGLKPANILLDERANAFVTDFEIAVLLFPKPKRGITVGTPGYMAPEQWRSEPLDARADVYALGVIMYLLMTGRSPFEATTPYALMFKHLNEAPTPPRQINPDISPAIEAVILRAVEKEPANRFANGRALADAFTAALKSGTVPAKPAESPAAARTTQKPPLAEIVEEVLTEPPSPQPQITVFISHSSKDDDFVDQLAADLRQSGVQTWVDHKDIVAGEDWDDSVQAALDRCDAMVLVLTPESVASRNVKVEWARYLKVDKPIIPVIHKPCEVPFRLELHHYVTFHQPSPAARSELLRALQRQVQEYRAKHK